MKRILLESLCCLIAIALFQMIWDAHLAAQEVQTSPQSSLSRLRGGTIATDSSWKPGEITLRRPWDETKWLTIQSHDSERDWHPSYVNIVSEYEPIVKKLSDGRYVITFTSEIAEGLP